MILPEINDGCSEAPRGPLDVRVTYRSAKVLEVIAVAPGSSNIEISAHAGIADQGQASKLLARMARVGLIENARAGQPRGITNAWHLTRRGEALESAMRREALQPPFPERTRAAAITRETSTWARA